MKMEELEVYCSEKGFVVLCQKSMGEEANILLTPEQCPVVIAWITRAAAESIEGNKPTEANPE